MQSIPRHIRWIVSLAILFFIWMFLMRFMAWWYFKPTGVSFGTSIPVFWLGFRFDAREVGILALLVLLTGAFPFLHPFQKKNRKNSY